VLQAQLQVLQEVLESWDTLHTEGEQVWIPATHLIKQLQCRISVSSRASSSDHVTGIGTKEDSGQLLARERELALL
jgi:hypothetical protein